MKKTAMLIGLAAVLGFSSNAQAVDWNWKGDIRYRYQSQLKDHDTSADEHSKDRNRIRFRVGADMWINEELSAGFGLSTGAADDPVSRNETLGDFFNVDLISLNEAYFNYHPMFLNGDVNLIMGKRYSNKTMTVMDDLIWDGDVTLEGVTLQYGKDANGKEKDGLCANAGYYLYDEADWGDNYVGQSSYIIAAQASYKGTVSDLGYQAGASYYDYQSFPTAASVDYNIVELFGNIGGKVSSLPWKVYAQYAFNTAEHGDYSGIIDAQRDAYLVGVKLGKAKNPGQLEGSIEYFNMEPYAVNGAMTDSDRDDLTANSNVKGWKFSTKYALIQNMNLGLNYFNTGYAVTPTGTSGNYRGHLLQLDAVVKF